MQKEKIKICPTCSVENDLYTSFCKQCGRRLREVVSTSNEQYEEFIRICPDCSHENSAYEIRCTECMRNLSGVKIVPRPLPTKQAIDKKEAQQPEVWQKSLSTFAKSIPQKRTALRKRNRVFVSVAVFLVMFLTLAVLIPRIFIEKGQGVKATPGPSPVHTQVSPQLPAGLGEVTTPGGQNIGVNDGSFAPFDISRPTLSLKQQAAMELKNGNSPAAISLWRQALSIESNDAEALIYLEDQRVLAAGKPYVTLVAGTSFTPPFPDAAYENELQGIYVAQHEFNQGSHAFLLRILIANSGTEAIVSNTAPIARQIVQIAQQDPTIVGVIGWLSSSNTVNALSTFSNAKMPIISPQASSDYLTGISPYFFRVTSPNKVQALAAAQFMKNILHVKNPVVFLDPKDLYSQNLANDFENDFAAGGHLPEETFVTDNTRSFSSLIEDALKYHPDAFYFTSASSVDAGLFQDALPTTGAYSHIPTVGGDGGYTIHKNGYGRWYFTEYAYHDESTLPIAKQFAQEYISDFDPGPRPQKPGGFYGYSLADEHAILSYDATSVVVTALQMADENGKPTLTPQILAATLPKITGANAFQGVSGQIAFGPDHDPVNKAIVILFASKDGHTQLYDVQGCFVKGCPGN